MSQPVIITHSESSSFKQCARKWYYSYELGIEPNDSGEALRMGTAFHEALDLLAQGKTVQEAVIGVLRSYATAAMGTGYAYELEQEIVCRLVYGYDWYWSGQPLQLEYVATEQEFQLPIINPETGAASTSTQQAGKVDKIAKLPDGRLCIVEHKTTGDDISAESDYWRKLRIDTQISHYVGAVQALGFDVETVLYDVARKPGIRPKQIVKKDLDTIMNQGTYFGEPCEMPKPDAEGKTKETARMFGARLLADICERPAFYYARQEIARLQSDQEEYAWELWQMQTVMREARNKQRFIRNTAQCMAFGKCQFFDICTSGNPMPTPDELPHGFRLKPSRHSELKGASTL